MFFLLASFYEFTLFLKIVLWIAVPLIIVSFVVTTIFHYRQKKKNAINAALHPEMPVNEMLDISLVARLQKEVFHYRRRIKELQHALSFVKNAAPPGSISPAITALIEPVVNVKSDDAVNQPDILPPGASVALVEDLQKLPGDDRMLAGDMAGTDENAPSRAYLQDLVSEQKTHVTFLQQQLETRIKSFHELEFQFRDNAALLEKMTLSYEHARHQLDDSEAASSMLRIEKDNLNAKISRLEKSLQELQEQQNKTLQLLSADAESDSMISELPGSKTANARKSETRFPAES